MAGSGGSPTVVTSIQPPQKPLNLLMAVSEIQQWSAVEKNSTTPIEKNYLTTQQRFDFFSVGIKNVFTHFIFTLFFTPFTVAVLQNLIHVFGDKKLTLFDEIYALILTFSVSLGFGVFLSSLKDCYVGNITKGMIKNLFTGIFMGEIFKDFIAAFLYFELYEIISPNNVSKFLLFLNKYIGSLLVKIHTNYTAVYYWILKFREVLPISVVFVVISSVLFAGIPIGVIAFHTLRFRVQKDDLDD